MLGLSVCLHVTQCLVVDCISELTMIITPARHTLREGHHPQARALPVLHVTYDKSECHVRQ